MQKSTPTTPLAPLPAPLNEPRWVDRLLAYLPPGYRRRPVFQDAYLWLILIASLDIMCTWIVLWHHGVEVNPIAKRVISYGPKGLVTYKFLLIVFVIFLCEVVGRRNRMAAKFLVGFAIGLTSLPVIIAITQLFIQKYQLLPELGIQQ